jgi:hypothetical protein
MIDYMLKHPNREWLTTETIASSSLVFLSAETFRAINDSTNPSPEPSPQSFALHRAVWICISKSITVLDIYLSDILCDAFAGRIQTGQG